MNKKNEPKHKKQYEKPVVSRFPLRAEEAVLGFCKSSGASGVGGNNCIDPISGGLCMFAGS